MAFFPVLHNKLVIIDINLFNLAVSYSDLFHSFLRKLFAWSVWRYANCCVCACAQSSFAGILLQMVRSATYCHWCQLHGALGSYFSVDCSWLRPVTCNRFSIAVRLLAVISKLCKHSLVFTEINAESPSISLCINVMYRITSLYPC